MGELQWGACARWMRKVHRSGEEVYVLWVPQVKKKNMMTVLFGPLLSELSMYDVGESVGECGYEAVAFQIWCAFGRRCERACRARSSD